ncbi:MAG: methyl-accepting chemotaxis protein [Candidatus Entotheonellia bacterium]
MRRLADIPIGRKLMLITALASAIALLLAGSILITYDTLSYRTQKTRELLVQAEILAASVRASVVFKDPKAAQEYLNALDANPEIAVAGVYAEDGTVFASYSRPRMLSRPLPPRAEPQGERFEGNELVVFWPVREGQRQEGTVYLRAITEPLATRLERYGGIMLLVLAGSLLITLPISMRLHAVILNPIREIAEAARQVAARDLTVKVTAQRRGDEIGVLVEAFEQMLENLREVMRQLGESAQVLTSSASEIVAKATEVASGTAEAATSVNEATATVEEVKQTTQVSSQRAKYVSESAQKAVQVSQAGKKAVDETIEGMSRIRHQVESIAESIVRLSEQSQAIAGIIATVSDFADQSNLLAVNASIEAAKAGEQGRGFAVVAQEVKSLAEQSKQATAQVRAILNDIHKATSAAVMATEQGSKAVEAGVKQSTEAGESIRALAESIAEAAQATAQITASSQQQLVGMDQVALAMENIKQASTQNVASTKQTETAAQNLHELGQKLKQLVERYKV